MHRKRAASAQQLAWGTGIPPARRPGQDGRAATGEQIDKAPKNGRLNGIIQGLDSEWPKSQARISRCLSLACASG
jgi:hypothetical protein